MRDMMNFKRYLTYMLILSALSGGMAEGKTSVSKMVESAEKSTLLTPYQEEVKNKIMARKVYRLLPPEIQKKLDFSKIIVEYNPPKPKKSRVFIPAGKEFGLTFSTQFGQSDDDSDIEYLHCLGARYDIVRPEYILPQYPQNEQYKKLSEKRFQIPSSAQKELTPEQFDELSTIMRIVKKDIDFLMNEPFYDFDMIDYRAGKYVGKLYANRKPYRKSKYASDTDFTPYFKERETPVEFEINNKLGRFLSLQEISEFDNQIKCFGECSETMNYTTTGGYFISGVRLSILGGLGFGDEYDSRSMNRIKKEGLYQTYKSFGDLIAGVGEIIKEHGVDPENLPNIKSPNVPIYDKCLAYIYMQAKEVHDIVMEANILPKTEQEEYNPMTKSIDGTLSDYISIDPKSPGLIKQDKTKIAKAKNKPPKRIGRQK